MITISLAMVVKNEEKYLEKTLKSVREIVDEIIIVDSGSKDRTKEIAKIYGAKLYEMNFEDDFSKLRNFSFEKANKDFVLWINAGEILKESSVKELKYIKKFATPKEQCFFIKTLLENCDLTESMKYIYQGRLIKKQENIKWKGLVYEVLELGDIKGKYLNCEIIKVKKESFLTLKNVERILSRESFEELSNRELFYYGNLLEKNYRIEDALSIYRKIISSNSKKKEYKVMATLSLASYYLKRKKYNQFKNYLFQSFELGPINSMGQYLMGEYLFEIGNIEGAINFYNLAINTEEEKTLNFYLDSSYKKCFSIVRLCDIYLKKGDYLKLRFYNSMLEKYLKKSPIVKYNKRYIDKENYYLGENI